MDRSIGNAVVAVARNTEAGANLLGTAFPLGGSRFATAAHVTGPSEQNLCIVIPKVNGLDSYQDTTDTQVQMLGVSIIAYDPIKDICILDAPGAQGNVAYRIGSSDEAPVGSNVVCLGYPHADHGRLVLTAQRTAVGARIILGSSGIKTKHLVLNVQARPGQSGGPIFSEDGRVLIAMLLGSYAPGGGGGISLGGVDPHTLHQTTHALSAEYISEALASC